MARQLTFLHTADLHIGASFRGLSSLSSRWGERLTHAIPQAYERVIDHAIENRVEFVVFAGDVFDEGHPSYADYRVFVEGLMRLDRAGIAAYIVSGNHDPYDGWQDDLGALPGNTTLFPADRPGFALHRFAGVPRCIVMGRSFPHRMFPDDQCVADGMTRSEAIWALGPEAVSATFAVGILHTGLDIDDAHGSAPVAPSLLAAGDIDYWALGHIHTRRSLPRDYPRMGYSGNIQGLDITETGPRGVNLVTLTEGAPPRIRFLPCASVAWQKIEVDVSACETVSSVEERTREAISHAKTYTLTDEICVRVSLTGASKMHGTLSQKHVLQDVRNSINSKDEQVFCDAIIDETRAPRNYDALRSAGLFPAVLLKAARTQAQDRDGTLSYLRDEFASRGLALPDDLNLNLPDLMGAAQSDVLDLLEGVER